MIKVGYNAIELGKSSGVGGSTTFDGLTDKATVDLPVVNTPLASALSGKEITANKKTDVDANKTSNTFFPTVKAVFDWVSGMFVKGAVTSTDNNIALFSANSGKLLKSSFAWLYPDYSIRIGTNETGSGVGSVGIIKFIPRSSPLLHTFLIDTWSSASELRLAGAKITLAVGETGTASGSVGVRTLEPTAVFDVNGTFRSRGDATLNGQIIDNAGSAGTDGQVLKKVGGLVVWSNP